MPGSGTYRINLSPKDIPAGATFRIRQTDFDGSFSYSPLAVLNSGNCTREVSMLSVHPQPAKDLITITRHSATPGTLTLRDLTGRIVLKQPIFGLTQTIPLPHLSPGTYLLSEDDSPATPIKLILR